MNMKLYNNFMYDYELCEKLYQMIVFQALLDLYKSETYTEDGFDVPAKQEAFDWLNDTYSTELTFYECCDRGSMNYTKLLGVFFDIMEGNMSKEELKKLFKKQYNLEV